VLSRQGIRACIINTISLDNVRLTSQVTLPTKRCHKVYRVGLNARVCQEKQQVFIEQFEQGIQLQREAQSSILTKLEFISEKEVLFSLTEGQSHQVKRVFATVGNRLHHP